MGDKISPKLDHHQGGLNRTNPSRTTICVDNLLASQSLVQRNLAQSLHSRPISDHKSPASYQTTVAPKEIQGKTLDPFKASSEHCSSSGNKSGNPLCHNSSNLTPHLATSIPVSHVGTTERYENPEEEVRDFAPPHNIPETLAAPHMPLLGSPGSPMPRCATAFSEQREATSIENFPEELRAQALATPEHFHEIILRAYNKPPRRLRDIRRRHVRFNPPSGCNLGENLLWLLECAAAGTPIFEVGPSWISKGGRGVFRTKYCVRLPKGFRIPLHGHFPSAPVTNEEEADAIFMGQPILRFWGGPDNAFICSRDSGGLAVLGHLMNTPVRGCRKGDTTYLARITPEGLASNQDLCQANCSFVNNPHWPQLRVRDSYTAPRSSEYGMVREMLVGYGNSYDV